MAGSILWLTYPAAASNCLTTELNSLADGNVCALGSEINNSTNQHLLADFQLDLASLTISSASAYCDIYLIPTVDGTNYPDFSSGAVANYHQQYRVGTILVKAVSATTARANLRGIEIPPGKYKPAVRNGVGATLAASGNTLAIRPYSASYT